MLAAFLLVCLSGCIGKPALPDYRYRLTVEVETPWGLRTGSSVIQVASHVASKYALRPGFVTTQIKGEAAAVDLPGGKVLFALLTKPDRADGADSYAFDALISQPWSGGEEYIRDVNALVARHDVGVLPAKDYPLLVTFGDTKNVTTITRVEPTDLSKHFGNGVRLRRITIQITDQPVTQSIERRLTWLTHMKQLNIPADFQPDGILVGNLQGLFTTEIYD